MIGSGYVGLITGACFANLGNTVICMDVDQKKIDMLNNGEMPIYEPGLKEMVLQNAKENRLSFTSDMKKAVSESDIIFLCVGTPSLEDGKADLKYVFEAAKQIGVHMNAYKVIVDKSTVPVGTSDKVKAIIKENLKQDTEFDVVSNPEFLREGLAISDFTIPDRIVLGVENDKAKDIMVRLYRAIERTGRPILITDPKSAEMIKYASNCMLATRISFMNVLAQLCEKVGGDVKSVAKGMGLDSRIGPRFLQAGVGYGGSCFPKDVRELMASLVSNEVDNTILTSVDTVNENQKKTLLPKIKKFIPDLKGKKIALWGLAFKPRTDDMREAPSITLIHQLLDEGTQIKAFDPVAQEIAKKLFPDIEYAPNPYEAVEGCDALVVVTEWDQFRELDFEKIKKGMNNPIIIDGRNVYEPGEMKELGFQYVGVGR
tara:strand:+ start:1451 stop:2737 length:1287 start_codon:yes stop_codon:yes gene_type:complete